MTMFIFSIAIRGQDNKRGVGRGAGFFRTEDLTPCPPSPKGEGGNRTENQDRKTLSLSPLSRMERGWRELSHVLTRESQGIAGAKLQDFLCVDCGGGTEHFEAPGPPRGSR